MNPKVGVVYAFDEVTGKYFELGEPVYLSSDDFLDGYECDLSEAPTTISATFTLYIQSKDKLKLLGITNNYIRLHGGKAIRRVPKRFLR